MQPTNKQDEFLSLIDQHKGAIIKVSSLYTRRKEEKDDLFQEIIIQLWKAWPNFKGQSKVSTWLYRIALNTAISGLRKKKTSVIYIDGQDLPHIADSDDHKEKEEKLKNITGVVENGVFAKRTADVVIVGSEKGVRQL